MAGEINPDTAQHHSNLEGVLDALLTDVTNIRTQVVALVTDMQSRVSDFNVLITKLNSDGGVSDTNYVSGTAKTAAAPTALTTTT